MKKLNRHMITFILTAAFVIAGAIPNALNGELPYHAQCMDLNSLKERLTGARLVVKDDMIVTRTSEDTLVVPHAWEHEDELAVRADTVKAFQDTLSEKGISFLYVSAPGKAALFTPPENTENFAPHNYSLFTSQLAERGVSLLDAKDVIENSFSSIKDAYFITDHHWRPETGLKVADSISRILDMYHYDPGLTDISSYEVTTLKKDFLGSFGQKTGALFTPGSPDDFSLIKPAFDTHCVMELPLRGETIEGTFEEAFLFPDRLEGGLYGSHHYAYYTGGDYRIQVLKNLNDPDGPKYLMIRDSFACAVAPFLAMQTSEVHIIDLREVDYIPEPRTDLWAYIDETSPDAVIVLYSNTGPWNGFDFN